MMILFFMFYMGAAQQTLLRHVLEDLVSLVASSQLRINTHMWREVVLTVKTRKNILALVLVLL